MLDIKSKTQHLYSLITKQSISFLLKNGFSYLKIILIFTIMWSVFSGSKDPLMIACGIVGVIATFILCILGKIISPTSYIIRLSFFRYVYILLRDVIISSIQMVKIIYAEKLKINPGTITMNVSKLTNQEKILFSNLITMTPGTFVIAVEGDNFLIHALNKDDLQFKDNREIKTLLQKMRSDADENNNKDIKMIIK